ncbi:hypothetical protein A2U01_0084049, partial [Trifolium medium]|nr:hypothetical protein [Trifolium medium]
MLLPVTKLGADLPRQVQWAVAQPPFLKIPAPGLVA